MVEDQAGARRVLVLLGDLLRLCLERMERAEVTLDEELEFMRQFLAIQQARFRGRFEVSWSVEAEVTCAVVLNA
jgi:LytS/YehU family sensor histidine kinase